MRIAMLVLALAGILQLGAVAGVCAASEAGGWSGIQESGVGEVAGSIQNKVTEIGARMDQNQTVQEVSAGLLQPIYQLAEYLQFPWFHWAAFALMVAGVVSFALQIVLTKLYLLMQLKLNLQEILSDTLGLLISAVGLVLTTQAAAQNSNFTTTPSLVVSSAAVGAVVGFLFYLWGQRTELRAARPDQKPVVVQDRRKM